MEVSFDLKGKLAANWLKDQNLNSGGEAEKGDNPPPSSTNLPLNSKGIRQDGSLVIMNNKSIIRIKWIKAL